jgi:hypothetical protein
MADGYADPGPGKPTRPGAYMHAEFGIPVIGAGAQMIPLGCRGRS